jgi:hypothetical protein
MEIWYDVVGKTQIGAAAGMEDGAEWCKEGADARDLIGSEPGWRCAEMPLAEWSGMGADWPGRFRPSFQRVRFA